jgi:hypothetical protein
MLNFILLETNWSNISGDWIGWLSTGYEYVFGNWLWALIFFGIIGYIYAVNRSAISAAAAICIIFGVFGATGIFRFPETSMFSMISIIIVVTSFAGLFTLLFVKKSWSD